MSTPRLTRHEQTLFMALLDICRNGNSLERRLGLENALAAVPKETNKIGTHLRQIANAVLEDHCFPEQLTEVEEEIRVQYESDGKEFDKLLATSSDTAANLGRWCERAEEWIRWYIEAWGPSDQIAAYETHDLTCDRIARKLYLASTKFFAPD